MIRSVNAPADREFAERARGLARAAAGLLGPLLALLLVGLSCVEGGGTVAGGNGDSGPAADSDTRGDGLLFDVDDPGGCVPPCGAGQSCFEGTCKCLGTTCGAACVDLAGDPLNCGACGVACGDEQYCRLDAGPNCKCRPPAVACTGTCRDRNSDPFACGACDNVCPGACAKGACVTSCPAGLTGCLVSGKVACVDVLKDPAHCGACGTMCKNDQVCAAGVCAQYRPAVGCTACPCPVCDGILGKGTTCCPPLTGQKSAICVRGTSCP